MHTFPLLKFPRCLNFCWWAGALPLNSCLNSGRIYKLGIHLLILSVGHDPVSMLRVSIKVCLLYWVPPEFSQWKWWFALLRSSSVVRAFTQHLRDLSSVSPCLSEAGIWTQVSHLPGECLTVGICGILEWVLEPLLWKPYKILKHLLKWGLEPGSPRWLLTSAVKLLKKIEYIYLNSCGGFLHF